MEIFASVQGEGLFVGRSSVFVRFGGCDLRCSWCDTPASWRRSAECRIELGVGSGECVEANPLPLERIERAVLALCSTPGGRVSLTGGEPLLQPEAVAGLGERLRRAGLAVHLETHGLAVDGLERVVDHVDWVAMDWKLASEVRWDDESRESAEDERERARRAEAFDERHRAFLRLADARSRVFVKLVVGASTRDEEVDRVCTQVARIAPDATLVLQPVTPTGRARTRPGPDRLLAWLRRCERAHRDVRLIPQTHPVYGVR